MATRKQELEEVILYTPPKLYKGSGLWSTYYILVTKDETWKMEYLRNDDTLKTPLGFLHATLIPVFGWAFLLYSAYVAIALYFKHVSK